MIAATRNNAAAMLRLKAIARAVKCMILGALVVLAYFWASANDYAEELAREQRTADIACRAAGASHAVRVDADGSSIYICNQPASATAIERAQTRALRRGA